MPASSGDVGNNHAFSLTVEIVGFAYSHDAEQRTEWHGAFQKITGDLTWKTIPRPWSTSFNSLQRESEVLLSAWSELWRVSFHDTTTKTMEPEPLVEIEIPEKLQGLKNMAGHLQYVGVGMESWSSTSLEADFDISLKGSPISLR